MYSVVYLYSIIYPLSLELGPGVEFTQLGTRNHRQMDTCAF